MAGFLHVVGPLNFDGGNGFLPGAELGRREFGEFMPQRSHLGVAAEFEVSPWSGHFFSPLGGAMVVNHLLLGGGHGVVLALVHDPDERRDIQGRVHVVLDDLVDAKQRQRTPGEGDADAITFPWGSLPLFGIDKVVKYHMDTPLYVTPFVWVMNKGKYNAMSSAQKKVIDDHCTTEWAEKVAAPWADFEFGDHAKMAALGHELTKLTPTQLGAWKKAVAPVEVQWANDVKKAGHDPKAVMDSLKQSLAKYKAAL